MRLSPSTFRRVAGAALVSLIVIVVTGGAVRLTGSGLGCPEWPSCDDGQLVAPLDSHAMIEFGNRMFTGFMSVLIVAAVLASLWRSPRRRDLTAWSFGLVAGVAAQVVLGGMLVRSGLDPRFTLGHFLLSMVLVWNAVVLLHRAGLPDDGAPSPGSFGRGDRALSRLIFAAGMVVVVTGTLVTGSGPHSGDDAAARLDFAVASVARIHGSAVVALVALVATTWWRVSRRGGPGGAGERQLRRLLLVLLVQGAVGYTQYFTGVPVVLVAIHLLGAAVVWALVVQQALVLSPAPSLDAGAGSAGAHHRTGTGRVASHA